MEKVLVLGAGMVGRAMAIDPCTSYEVTAADINEPVLQHLAKEHSLKTVKADLSKADVIAQLVPDYDLVVGAVPGHLGFNMLKTVIECAKNIVDISFSPEDPFALDELARQKKVTAVVDCGVAPGMSNLLLDSDFKRRGICPPEYIGAEPGCAEKMLAYLKTRKIYYLKTSN